MCCVILQALLVVLNIIVLLFGIGVITVSLLISNLFGEGIELLLTTEFHLTTWLIVVGVVIAIIGFLGSCGVIMKNRWMLYTYAVIVFLLVAAQVAFVIIATAATDTLIGWGHDAMIDFFGLYYSEDPVLRNATDIIQRELECCGVSGYEDWLQEIGDEDVGNKKVPPSCCMTGASSACISNPMDHLNDIYKDGCYDKIVYVIEPFLQYLLYGCIGLIAVQVLCIIQACATGIMIGKRRKNPYASNYMNKYIQ